MTEQDMIAIRVNAERYEAAREEARKEAEDDMTLYLAWAAYVCAPNAMLEQFGVDWVTTVKHAYALLSQDRTDQMRQAVRELLEECGGGGGLSVQLGVMQQAYEIAQRRLVKGS